MDRWLVIEHCGDCPHHFWKIAGKAKWAYKREVHCEEMGKDMTPRQALSIPKWCPLPISKQDAKRRKREEKR